MKPFLRTAVCAVAVAVSVVATAQPTQPILTADSLATGNWKDVLTSFFQLSFDRLTSDRKELNFQSNPFAVLLRSNPDAAIDTNYYKYRRLRKLNFGFGLALDPDFRFNGFSSGVKYALINQRDVTTSTFLFRQLGADALNADLRALLPAVNRQIQNRFPNTEANRDRRLALLQQVNDFFNDSTSAFNNLDAEFQSLVLSAAEAAGLRYFLNLVRANPAINVKAESNRRFAGFKDELQNKLLWTLSLSDTTYTDRFFFSNVVLRTDLLKGMGKPKPGANWELNLQAAVNFLDDSTRRGHDLSRSLFRFEPGVNLVFRNKANQQSWLEAKLSGSYFRHFGNLYAAERRDSLNLNATLRVRLIGDIWVPLEVRYDPRSGNVFGFLNVRFNFNGQGRRPASQT